MSMYIKVEKIKYKTDKIIVTGSTAENGMIKGVWKSNAFPIPIEKGEYMAELSFYEYVKKVSKCPKKESSTAMRDTIVVFQGIIEGEGTEEDAYCVRFDDGWIEWLPMLEIADDCSEISEGDCVTFSVQYYNIGIFPYDMLGERSPARSKLPERTETEKKQKKKKRK